MASPAEDRHPPILLRDDSWLSFNARVLEEAMDPAVPLLERAKFLSIFIENRWFLTSSRDIHYHSA